jgi:hypothetical protein
MVDNHYCTDIGSVSLKSAPPLIPLLDGSNLVYALSRRDPLQYNSSFYVHRNRYFSVFSFDMHGSAGTISIWLARYDNVMRRFSSSILQSRDDVSWQTLSMITSSFFESEKHVSVTVI